MARQGPRNAGIEPLLDPTTGRRTFRHLAGTGEGPRAAEVALQAALTVARQQRARMWELRAAYDLARLWSEQREKQKAYDLLAPLYGWFSEGFDTPDLRQAKALLDALR
jgi:predicted ATPase